MPPTMEHAYRAWLAGLNINVPHPLDQERFRQMILVAHRTRTKFTSYDLEKKLLEDGLPPEEAELYAERYEEGRALLKTPYPAWWYESLRERWLKEARDSGRRSPGRDRDR